MTISDSSPVSSMYCPSISVTKRDGNLTEPSNPRPPAPERKSWFSDPGESVRGAKGGLGFYMPDVGRPGCLPEAAGVVAQRPSAIPGEEMS